MILSKNSCVIAETIQGAAGFLTPSQNYFKNLKKRCEEVGALLILDEIQPGFGRTGKLFSFSIQRFATSKVYSGDSNSTASIKPLPFTFLIFG